MTYTLLAISLILLVAFAALNGAHDASNTIAAAVKTRALTPLVAIRLSTFFALLGALAGGFLWPTLAIGVHSSWISLPAEQSGPIIIMCVILAAFIWNLATLLMRMPSSSTHALIGGIAGVYWASTLKGTSGPVLNMPAVIREVIIPLLLIPPCAFLIALAFALGVAWFVQDEQFQTMNRRLRLVQSIATSTMALAHAIATAQRLGFLGWLAMKAVGAKLPDSSLPLILIFSIAISFAIGTYSGGWRITDTLSNKLVPLDPLKGSIAQILPAVLYLITALMRAPASSSHLFTNSLLGAGTVPRWKAVNTDLVVKIIGIWFLTPFVTALLSGIFYLALSNFF